MFKHPLNAKYLQNPSVCAQGSPMATCLVLLDFPNIQATKADLPLVGYAANIWRELWQATNIPHNYLRLENVYPEVPENFDLKGVPEDRLFEYFEALHDRISEYQALNLILTTGNYSTYALTGKGKIPAALNNLHSDAKLKASDAEKRADNTKLRGSIYTYTSINGKRIKVMPMLSPYDIIRFPKWVRRAKVDWLKASNEMKFSEHREIKRVHIIDPSEWEVENFVKNSKHAKVLSTDIETWGNKLSCIGFAPNPTFSITIPTVDRAQLKTFMPHIQKICEGPSQKLLCNGLYDTYWLDFYKTPVINYVWDVQYMHHCLDPIESHSLDFLASIYAQANYWKDEAKSAEEIVKYSRDLEALWVYNGLDCCLTYEVWLNLIKDLSNNDCLKTYFKLYVSLLEPLLAMSRYGIRVHRKAQNLWRKEIENQQHEIREQLEEIAGDNLFATETKTFYREPTQDEWDLLLPETTTAEDFDDRGIPNAKIIKRANRDALKEKGIVYFLSGQKAGKVSYKEEIDKKDFSTAKLLKLFHDTLGLPKQFKRRKGKEKRTQTIDEAAIRKLIQKFPNQASEAGHLLLLYREIGKEHIYLRGGYDKDGRLRAGFYPTTTAGRLKSAKNPRGTGFNLQNLKR